MKTSLWRASAFLTVLCTPAVGMASIADDVEAVAVVDALDLPNALIDSMNLWDYDGPVIVAHVAGLDDGVTDYWLRFDHDLRGDSVLSGVPELAVLDRGYDRVPALVTDRRDRDLLMRAIGLDSDDVRGIVDPQFVHPDMLEALDSEDTAALVSVAKDVDRDTVSIARVPGVQFLVPELVRVAALDSIAHAYDSEDYLGLACDGSRTDSCEIASNLESDSWIEWVVGPVVEDHEEPEGDSGDTAADDVADGTAPDDDDVSDLPEVLETHDGDETDEPTTEEPPAGDGGGSPNPPSAEPAGETDPAPEHTESDDDDHDYEEVIHIH
ncbi:MAG: hypothetical protein GY898_04990 [Proteobacteria bacterium]|nr:hypothetical protein [Pseudomonadota bacterium]